MEEVMTNRIFDIKKDIGKYDSDNWWHPLMKYINAINLSFLKENGLEDNYHLEGCSFKDRLNFLKENKNEEYSELIKVFEPLIINEYDGLTLFKYESYIVLNDMGYGSDFFDLYGGLYLHCRSIVIDTVKMYVALASFDKFKNYNEDANIWSEKNINNIISNSTSVEITNKLDGSYQQYSWDANRNRIIGSGSAGLDINESWRLEEGFKMLNEDYQRAIKDYDEWTFIFEFISVKNPIVVHYKKEDEGLYLIGMRNKKYGIEFSYKGLNKIAKKYNLKITEYYQETLGSILAQTDKYLSSEKEGWVFACWDNVDMIPFRFKLKTDDYVLMHKTLSKVVSPNAIIESVMVNRYDDLRAKIPDAFKDYADKIYTDLNSYVIENRNIVERYYGYIEINYDTEDFSKENKKEVMLAIEKYIPKKYQGNARALYLKGRLNFTHEDWFRMFVVKGKDSKTPGHIKYGEILEFLKENVKGYKEFSND